MTCLIEDLDILEDQTISNSDPKKSIVLCTRILKLWPKYDYSYLTWALQLLKQGQCQEAKQKFKRSIQFSSHKPSRYETWLDELYFAREFEEALLFAEEYFDKFSAPHYIHNTVGVCFLHLGDYGSAIKGFQDATQIKNSFGLAYFNWALALYLQGKKGEALEMSEKADQIHELPEAVYEREINMLKEDLKREENKRFEDLIKMKIEGFQYFIEMAQTKREQRDEDIE